MNDISQLAPPFEIPLLSNPKLFSREAARAKEPYAIRIAFTPMGERRYTVHIRPAGQSVLPRTAYFTEFDMKNALEACFPSTTADQIFAQLQAKGVCDLREKKVYLDIARAAALGWFGSNRFQSL